MTLPETLAAWLAHCDRMHPRTMDLSLERTVEVRRRMGIRFDVPVVVVAGTNGKGSTCAFIEAIGLQAGWRVGLYQKPELVHFDERCRIGGLSVGAEPLMAEFAAVEAARGGITLTRFEFSTLAIARLLSRAPLDLVILEVGLGGRYDAVNAFDADCAVLTNIALDHMEFLGHDREAIGAEKAQVMRPGKPAIVGDPDPPHSVLRHAQAIGADLWLAGRDFGHDGDRTQWNWSGRGRRRPGLAYPALRGANQLLNASAAIAVYEALQDRLPVSAQAVRGGLASVELPGRFQVVPGSPTLVLDVAHNPQSVAVLARNLDAMGFHPRTFAVFGAMADKDLDGMIEPMRPLVDVWHLTALPAARAASTAQLAEAVEGGRQAVQWVAHADPAGALQAALAQAGPTDRIVVFGSFLTVGGVLKQGLPTLSSRHGS